MLTPIQSECTHPKPLHTNAKKQEEDDDDEEGEKAASAAASATAAATNEQQQKDIHPSVEFDEIHRHITLHSPNHIRLCGNPCGLSFTVPSPTSVYPYNQKR